MMPGKELHPQLVAGLDEQRVLKQSDIEHRQDQHNPDSRGWSNTATTATREGANGSESQSLIAVLSTIS